MGEDVGYVGVEDVSGEEESGGLWRGEGFGDIESLIFETSVGIVGVGRLAAVVGMVSEGVEDYGGDIAVVVMMGQSGGG